MDRCNVFVRSEPYKLKKFRFPRGPKSHRVYINLNGEGSKADEILGFVRSNAVNLKTGLQIS